MVGVARRLRAAEPGVTLLVLRDMNGDGREEARVGGRPALGPALLAVGSCTCSTGVARREDAPELSVESLVRAFLREVVRMAVLDATGRTRARRWGAWWESVAVWGGMGHDEGKGGKWVT